MQITRRRLVSTAMSAAVAGVAGLILPRRVWAQTEISDGARRVDTLSDGHLVLPRNMVLAVDEGEAAGMLDALGVTGDTVAPDCNVTLLRDGERTVLFDVGAGPDFMPTAGKLMEAFDALGLDPAEVTHVVFSHGHPDHLWGLLDDFDEPVFPEAVHMMGRAEFDYWMDPSTVDTIGEARLAFAAGARRRLEMIADRIEFFEDGQEIIPGVAARASFGHTPGHMAFELAVGSDGLMVVGDAIGNPHIAFARPDLPSGMDQDPEAGAATRVALLDEIAARQMTMIGFHLPSPGIGRAEAADGGYRFVPAE